MDKKPVKEHVIKYGGDEYFRIYIEILFIILHKRTEEFGFQGAEDTTEDEFEDN